MILWLISIQTTIPPIEYPLIQGGIGIDTYISSDLIKDSLEIIDILYIINPKIDLVYLPIDITISYFYMRFGILTNTQSRFSLGFSYQFQYFNTPGIDLGFFSSIREERNTFYGLFLNIYSNNNYVLLKGSIGMGLTFIPLNNTRGKLSFLLSDTYVFNPVTRDRWLLHPELGLELGIFINIFK